MELNDAIKVQKRFLNKNKRKITEGGLEDRSLQRL